MAEDGGSMETARVRRDGDDDASRWGDLARPPLREEPLRRALLTPSGPYRRFQLVDRVASTNVELAALAAGGGWPDLSVLTADHQSAGRGRLGRTWSAPPRSSLATSVLLRPGEVPIRAWSWLPLLGGLAVAQSLRDVAGLDASLKWPNDVLVTSVRTHGEPRKICGVLSELVDTPEGQAVVLGFGVNVSQRDDELPVPTATSMVLAGAAVTDRGTVLRACLRALADWYERWTASAGDAVRSGLAAAVRESCRTLGQEVRVELPGGRPPVLGTAEGLDDDGRLLVRTADGELITVAAGDVVHLRRQADRGDA